MLNLKKASIDDCKQIHSMQFEAFKSLLRKYNDIDTNPAAEPIERIVQKMNQDSTDYYLIKVGNKAIGAIRIIRLENDICRISQIFIIPKYQGKGYAQLAIRRVESLYPQAKGWTLDTIKEEEKLCHLYEKMGYRATEQEEVIQSNMTIVYYSKLMKMSLDLNFIKEK